MTILSDPDVKFTKIRDVHSGSVTFETGWSYGWSSEWPEPRVGDDIVIVSSGSSTRGLAINDHVIFYRTAEHDRKYHEARRKAREREERIKFYLVPFDLYSSSIDSLHAFLRAYEPLPDVFQRRIRKFVGERDDWVRRFGRYEMSCCLDAVKIGDWLKKNGATEENYKLFRSGEAPLKLWDGHSGNSHDFAVLLGWWYATDPEMVVLEHGALTPLVGCDEYGCPHPFPHLEVAEEEGNDEEE